MYKTYGLKDDINRWFTAPTIEELATDAVKEGWFGSDETIVYDCDWRGRDPAIIRIKVKVPKSSREPTERELRWMNNVFLCEARLPTIELVLQKEERYTPAERAQFYGCLLGRHGRNGLPGVYCVDEYKPMTARSKEPRELDLIAWLSTGDNYCHNQKLTKPDGVVHWCPVCEKIGTCRCY